MTLGPTRRKTLTKGSLAGLWGPIRSPRVAISWPHDLLIRIAAEAYREGVPFAEIVRRRMKASYEGKP